MDTLIPSLSRRKREDLVTARKTYSAEFRRDAVELYLCTRSAKVAGIAADLGVMDSTLSGWIKVSHPGVSGDWIPWKDLSRGTSQEYPRELRERAVRMVAEVRPDYPSVHAAMSVVAKRLGVGSAETVRGWVRRGQVDATTSGAGDALNGVRPGHQLTIESAESAFTSSSRLSSSAIADSREIISGSRLGNKYLIQRLTSDGSDIADWGNYTTLHAHTRARPATSRFTST